MSIHAKATVVSFFSSARQRHSLDLTQVEEIRELADRRGRR